MISELQKHKKAWEFSELQQTVMTQTFGFYEKFSWPHGHSGLNWLRISHHCQSSNPPHKDFFTKFLSGLVMSHMLMRVDFLSTESTHKYVGEMMSKIRQWMGTLTWNPLRLGGQLQSVPRKNPLRAEQASTDSEVRQSFYRVVAWERKESLFNIKLVPIQP